MTATSDGGRRVARTKICVRCGRVFRRPTGTSTGLADAAWERRRFCSLRCAAQGRQRPKYRERRAVELEKGDIGNPYRYLALYLIRDALGDEAGRVWLASRDEDAQFWCGVAGIALGAVARRAR